MLNEIQRIRNYEWQNHLRRGLTPRQQRRVNHKRNHQSVEAMDRRDQLMRARVFAIAERRRRADTLRPATS
jgi:hypothetical protein